MLKTVFLKLKDVTYVVMCILYKNFKIILVITDKTDIKEVETTKEEEEITPTEMKWKAVPEPNNHREAQDKPKAVFKTQEIGVFLIVILHRLKVML